MKKQLPILLLILIGISLLTGCKPEATDSVTMENPVVVNPTAEIGGTGYPAPQPVSGYPAPGTSGSQVIDNASQMTVEILSLTPNAKDPRYVIAHVKVKTTTPVEGKPEYNPDVAGQEIDINLLAADAANLAVGDALRLTASFRGDEWGGGYYGSDISKE